MSFSILPLDIQLIVFDYARSPLKTSRVCKSWKQHSLSENLLNNIFDNFKRNIDLEIFKSLTENIPTFDKLSAYQKLKSIFSRQWTKIAVRYNLNENEARKFPIPASEDIFAPSKVAAAEKELMDNLELDLFMIIRNLYNEENIVDLYSDFLQGHLKKGFSFLDFFLFWNDRNPDSYKKTIINNKLGTMAWQHAFQHPENIQMLELRIRDYENIPSEIQKFCNLKSLIIKSGQMEYLPKELLTLTSLKIFKIAKSNKLTRLSPAFKTTSVEAIKTGLANPVALQRGIIRTEEIVIQ